MKEVTFDRRVGGVLSTSRRSTGTMAGSNINNTKNWKKTSTLEIVGAGVVLVILAAIGFVGVEAIYPPACDE